MSHRFQILCIKSGNSTDNPKLTHIGGKNQLGESWSLTVEKAIEHIKSGEMEFFLTYEGKTFDVIVSEASHDLLALRPGSKEFPLLSNLPNCPD